MITRIKITDPMRINYLVRKRFPDHPDVTHALAFGSESITPVEVLRGQAKDPDLFKKIEKEVQAFQAELKSKPPNELHALYKEEQTKELDEKEKAQFYNQPNADADFEYWSKMTYWKLDEAIALSFGKNPSIVNWEILKSKFTYNYSSFYVEYKKLRELAVRAKTWKKLHDSNAPVLFIKWVRDNDVSFPEELANLVEKRFGKTVDWKEHYDELLEKHNADITSANEIITDKNKIIAALETTQSEEKQLGTREKETLLKIIIGMAVEQYDFDPSAKRSSTTSDIVSDLNQCGISIDADTVRSKLKEAADLLPRDNDD